MADVSGIFGTPVAPINPLQTLSGWQDYANKVAQNAQIKASTANTEQNTINQTTENDTKQQELAVKKAQRNAQMIYSLSNLPDQQLQGGKPLYDTLDQEVATGQLDPKHAAVFKQQIDAVTQSGGAQNGAAYRPMLNSLLAGTLGGQQAAQFLQGSPVSVDSGQGLTGGLQGGVGSQAPGALQMNGQTVPTGLLSQASGAQPTVVQTPNGPLTTTVAGLNRSVNPGAAPPNRIPGNGSYGGGGSGSAGGAPGLPAGISGPKLGAQEDVNQNISAFNSDQQQVPVHQQNSQNLEKAHDALEIVGTGVGAPQALASLRSKVVGLFNATGYQPPEKINLQDASAAELDKYLIAYARQSASGAGTNLDQQLSSQSNASSHINPTAARSVINTNIGQERMAVALNQTSPDSAGYLKHKSAFSTQFDPRGFAADMYTTSELKSIYAKMTGPERKKFENSIDVAAKFGMINPGRQNQLKGGVTVNPAPSTIPGGPQAPDTAARAPARPAPVVAPPAPVAAPTNMLTNPPNPLSRYGD